MNATHAPDHRHDLDLEAALDFLNTRELESGRLVDHLVAPSDASEWFVTHGVLHSDDATAWSATELARVRVVRDALRAVVDAVVEDRAPAADSLDLVNGAL